MCSQIIFYETMSTILNFTLLYLFNYKILHTQYIKIFIV